MRVFWEHVRAEGRAAAIERAGFAPERIERFSFPYVGFPIPTKPQILGTAIRA